MCLFLLHYLLYMETAEETEQHEVGKPNTRSGTFKGAVMNLKTAPRNGKLKTREFVILNASTAKQATKGLITAPEALYINQ